MQKIEAYEFTIVCCYSQALLTKNTQIKSKLKNIFPAENRIEGLFLKQQLICKCYF